MTYQTFDDWFRAVDREVAARAGLSARDLPDICYRDLYNDGATPADAAEEALEEAGWEDA